MPDILGSADELDFARYLRPGDGVVWGQACAEPRTLVEALLARPVPGLTAFVGIPADAQISQRQAGQLRLISYTGAGRNAALHAAGLLDVLPAPYSALPELLRTGRLRADAVLVQLSPPDEAGRYSLGIAREYLADALALARVIIGEVSPLVPWTHGAPALTAGELTAVVPARYPPAEVPAAPAVLATGGTTPLHPPAPPAGGMTEVQQAIARHVAGLIEDGATLQFGLGALAEAVLAELTGHRHLGVHSGILPEGLVELMERGVVTGERKTTDRGIAVGGLLLGGRRLFDFADRNERIELRPTSYTHDGAVLAAQRCFVALNSALEVDLTGQVNAEVARGRYLGSVGGAADFLRGAARSPGGVPVVMLPATAGMASRVVTALSGPVSTARGDVGVVVTEHGVADLRGLTLHQRAERMIAIAAPEVRGELDRGAEAALAGGSGAARPERVSRTEF